ncbi:MAG: SIR2 family protein [Gammaproteobacteria bacterium]|nr:SIR2 family protein [Gammaproteobacteria bacterium]
MSETTAPIPTSMQSAALSTFGKPMFFGPEAPVWKELTANVPVGASPEEEQKIVSAAKGAKEDLKNLLLSSLQMQHVVVLAGSGTSLGPLTKGPSMWNLWDFCVNANPGAGDAAREMTEAAAKAISEIGYDIGSDRENIEALLSRCEAYLQVKSNAVVASFITESKKVILKMCSEFIDPTDVHQIAAHRTFLHRLSRRRVRDSRLKLFTTNYDVCFETAAGKQGLVVLDGFSFTQPRHFDPRFFLYDIVRRPTTGDDIGTPLEGVFHIYKLHGSVNWARKGENDIEIEQNPAADSACLIYPAKGKYQQSYAQPHLELVAQYFSVLREPNTCLIVTGFGFNDDHLSEPILAAVRTNPHLRLIIVNPSADDVTARQTEKNKYWDTLFSLTKQGEDIWLINADFADFSEMIPDLKTLTPAQRLTRDIKLMAGTK